jgi:primosomal protein N'
MLVGTQMSPRATTFGMSLVGVGADIGLGMPDFAPRTDVSVAHTGGGTRGRGSLPGIVLVQTTIAIYAVRLAAAQVTTPSTRRN